ncbi:bifunctional aspartate kinase/homoserine dehydrogenase I [Silvanigrella aquatica]|uniref:Bifunctional aspartate kinase/homoserine dehydrogenase I n=1 Tax=Silvanigrella aquatica TaxID=1915309 RepID=A0A1L4D0G3_9BACT|nr:bifunctional aspartate kinase/homoserine dehydrogenase I [Silvanigrella aquatica]APJ03702.1 bifunctional aspartate kinase/homoserine dehydrogenase I [Silvanigrella aquatica]
MEYFVHKFGGSNLKQSESFHKIKNVLSGHNEIIVVSALHGVTSALQNILNLAQEGKNYFNEIINIKNLHMEIINQFLFEEKKSAIIKTMIDNDVNILKNILTTVSQISSYSIEIQDYVLGFGEIWSAKILSSFLGIDKKVEFLNATKVLFTFHQNGIQFIDWEKSDIALQNFLKENTFDQLVITGFIASNSENKRTTLGRNGSDYSAAVFSKLLNSKSLTIWKDVNGIYSANPEKVKRAFPIPNLSYKEALELAYFGAKILHPRTIAPALEKNIPIFIKNIFNPDQKGTLISNQIIDDDKYLIKGVTCIEDISLFNIEGAGMIGVSGIAARIFQVIQNENISVILISQASSEYSICFAVSSEHEKKALKILKQNLEIELKRKQIEKISVNNNCSILAIVGDKMVGTLGIASRLCTTLSKANINISAIAQGSSERNISVVIDKKDIDRALNAVHSGFYLSDKKISIGIIGLGSVGSTFINQIQQAHENLKLKYNVDFSIMAIMNSKKMLLSENSINLSQWNAELNKSGIPSNIDYFINHLAGHNINQTVLIDCTASHEISNHYLKIIGKEIHIITPNKHANAGDFEYYKKIKELCLKKNTQYFYEATVCAGLPVINTIQDLIKTGDEIISIEGIISGTFSYIFNEMMKGRLFSEAVLEAKKRGYTEPDPREDLSGLDVARKLICLARELGFEVVFSDIQLTSLVPNHLKSCCVGEFLERLPECDAQMLPLMKQTSLKNEKLCYVGTIHKNGKLTVELSSYKQNHPFHRLQGTDNMLIIYSKRYHEQPLVIQGPGAGAEVTATGIFSDLLRLSSSLS